MSFSDPTGLTIAILTMWIIFRLAVLLEYLIKKTRAESKLAELELSDEMGDGCPREATINLQHGANKTTKHRVRFSS